MKERRKGKKVYGQSSEINSAPAGGRVWGRGKNCGGAWTGTGFERIYPDGARASSWILRYPGKYPNYAMQLRTFPGTLALDPRVLARFPRQQRASCFLAASGPKE